MVGGPMVPRPGGKRPMKRVLKPGPGKPVTPGSLGPARPGGMISRPGGGGKQTKPLTKKR